jgi:hypothetical protein
LKLCPPHHIEVPVETIRDCSIPKVERMGRVGGGWLLRCWFVLLVLVSAVICAAGDGMNPVLVQPKPW